MARLAIDLKSVQKGNDKMEALAESKLLDYNHEKSSMLILGSRKFQKKINDELKSNPIIFCGKIMAVKESEKYLGDYLTNNLSESVFKKTQHRKGLVLRLIQKIRVTIDDIRSKCLGGLKPGLDIWNLAVVPFLYNNSECWIDIPKKAMDVLNHLQYSFLISLFGSSSGCLTPIPYWNTGILTPENYIIFKKLLMYHHLMLLPNESLAK